MVPGLGKTVSWFMAIFVIAVLIYATLIHPDVRNTLFGYMDSEKGKLDSVTGPTGPIDREDYDRMKLAENDWKKYFAVIDTAGRRNCVATVELPTIDGNNAQLNYTVQAVNGKIIALVTSGESSLRVSYEFKNYDKFFLLDDEESYIGSDEMAPTDIYINGIRESGRNSESMIIFSHLQNYLKPGDAIFYRVVDLTGFDKVAEGPFVLINDGKQVTAQDNIFSDSNWVLTKIIYGPKGMFGHVHEAVDLDALQECY